MNTNNLYSMFLEGSDCAKSSTVLRASASRRGLQEEDNDDGDDNRPSTLSPRHREQRDSFVSTGLSSTSSSLTYASIMKPGKASQWDKHSARRWSSTESVASTGSSTSATTQTTASQSTYKSRPLRRDFQPGPYDVICARGKQAFGHSGNKHFRQVVDRMVDKYSTASSKTQRSSIVSDIVENTRSKARAGFVKQDNDGGWVEVGDTLAREKVGQLFRNALSNRYKSSNSSKKRRREEVAHTFHEALHKVMIQNETVQATTQSMAAYAAQPKIADDHVVEMFTRRNSALLEGVIKPDQELVDEFTKTFSAGMTKAELDNMTAEDDDIDMEEL